MNWCFFSSAINIFGKTPLAIVPHNSFQLQLQLSFVCTNFLPSLASNISVFFPCHLTLFSFGIYLPFLPYFQEKMPAQPSWPSALSAGFPTFRNFLLLFPYEVIKKWPALIAQHIQKYYLGELQLLILWVTWSFFSTCLELRFCCPFPPVNRVLKFDHFMVIVAKMATKLQFTYGVLSVDKKIKEGILLSRVPYYPPSSCYLIF